MYILLLRAEGFKDCLWITVPAATGWKFKAGQDWNIFHHDFNRLFSSFLYNIDTYSRHMSCIIWIDWAVQENNNFILLFVVSIIAKPTAAQIMLRSFFFCFSSFWFRGQGMPLCSQLLGFILQYLTELRDSNSRRCDRSLIPAIRLHPIYLNPKKLPRQPNNWTLKAVTTRFYNSNSKRCHRSLTICTGNAATATY